MPLVPQKGTLGASGDLAPLAHLALGLMGEGQMWSAKTGWTDAATVGNDGEPCHTCIIVLQALAANGLKPIELEAKEVIYSVKLLTSSIYLCLQGIALINGTQLITSLGAEGNAYCKQLSATLNYNLLKCVDSSSDNLWSLILNDFYAIIISPSSIVWCNSLTEVFQKSVLSLIGEICIRIFSLSLCNVPMCILIV